MIKKARITESYHINMYCDKCGKMMVKSNYLYTSNPPMHEYKCECGHVERSRISFPVQHVIFDLDNAEGIAEEELGG